MCSSLAQACPTRPQLSPGGSSAGSTQRAPLHGLNSPRPATYKGYIQIILTYECDGWRGQVRLLVCGEGDDGLLLLFRGGFLLIFRVLLLFLICSDELLEMVVFHLVRFEDSGVVVSLVVPLLIDHCLLLLLLQTLIRSRYHGCVLLPVDHGMVNGPRVTIASNHYLQLWPLDVLLTTTFYLIITTVPRGPHIIAFTSSCLRVGLQLLLLSR
jgi:hypothetical protein